MYPAANGADKLALLEHMSAIRGLLSARTDATAGSGGDYRAPPTTASGRFELHSASSGQEQKSGSPLQRGIAAAMAQLPSRPALPEDLSSSAASSASSPHGGALSHADMLKSTAELEVLVALGAAGPKA